MLEGAIKQAERSLSPEVRNPMMRLKAAQGLKSLSPEVRKALRSLLMEHRSQTPSFRSGTRVEIGS